MNVGLVQGRCSHHRQKIAESASSHHFWEPEVLPGFLGHSQSQSCAGEFFEVGQWGVEEWRRIASLTPFQKPKNKFARLNHISIVTVHSWPSKYNWPVRSIFAFAGFPTQPFGSQEFCNADSGRLHCVERRWTRLGCESQSRCDVIYSCSVTPLSWHNVCLFWHKAPGCKNWFGHGMSRRARPNLRDDWKVLLKFAAIKNLVWFISFHLIARSILICWRVSC